MASYWLNLDFDEYMLDGRFKRLAIYTGEHEYIGRMRVQLLWAHCHRHRTNVITSERIDCQTEGPDGYWELLLRARLIEKTEVLNEFKICGVKDRIKRLVDFDQGKSAGGKSRMKNAERDEKGRLKGKNNPADIQHDPADLLDIDQQSPAIDPAGGPANPASLSLSVSLSDSKNKIQKPVFDISADAVRECKEAWGAALKHHKAERMLLASEELAIGRAIQRFGAEAVRLALLGAKHEPSSEAFNPSHHLSLARVFDPQKFERFVSLGAQARKKLETRALVAAQSAGDEEPGVPVDPEKVRALMDRALGRAGGAA